MTDFTSLMQDTSVGATLTPTFTACTAADKFQAQAGSKYMLYYRNGATPTTQCYIREQVATAPLGTTPAIPTGAVKWSDALISAAIGGTSDRVVFIDVVAPYIDSLGFVNLVHNTPTTLTLAVLGPF